MEDLLARVKAATGPDRELSVAIWFALNPDREHLWALSGMNAQRGPKQNTEATLRRAVQQNPRDYGWEATDHDFTASLDAALALVERVLETDFIDIEVAKRFVAGEARGRAEICGPAVDAYGEAATPALALLAALLSALATPEGEAKP